MRDNCKFSFCTARPHAAASEWSRNVTALVWSHYMFLVLGPTYNITNQGGSVANQGINSQIIHNQTIYQLPSGKYFIL